MHLKNLSFEFELIRNFLAQVSETPIKDPKITLIKPMISP